MVRQQPSMKKKLLLTFAAAYALTYAALTAADPDLVKGVDFTGSSSVTAARLNQLVDNAYVGPYRGLIIYTNSAPSVSTIAKYARYLWLDSSVMPPTPKVWNTNSGGFWTNVTAIATIADYSVTTSKIATNAVTTVTIADSAVTGAKILDGTISGAKIATGTITTTNITDGTITGTDIASGTIASGNIQAAAITASLLAANSVGTSNLQSGFALQGTNIAAGTIVSSNLAAGAVTPTNVAASPAAMQLPRVNAAGTGFEWVNGGLLQYAQTNTTATSDFNTTITVGTGALTTSSGSQLFSLSFTPKSASSRLKITVAHVGYSSTTMNVTTTIFSDSTCLISDVRYTGNNTVDCSKTVVTAASGTTNTRVISVRVGPSAGTYHMNQSSGGAALYGGQATASLIIEEIY